jgi:hypothetical protein
LGARLFVGYDLIGISYAILFAIILNYVILSIWGNLISGLSFKDFLLAHKSGFYFSIIILMILKIILSLTKNQPPFLIILISVLAIIIIFTFIFTKMKTYLFWDEDTYWLRTTIIQKLTLFKKQIFKK